MNNRFKLSSIVGFWFLSTVGAASAAEPPTTSFRDAAQQEREAAWVATGDAAGPSDLTTEARCSEVVFRTAEIDMSWFPVAETEGRVQRIDISKFRDGFETGRFETSGELLASRDSARLAAPEPGVNYYWRVARSTDSGWVSSPIARFEVPICAWDKPSDPLGRPAARQGESDQGGRQ